MICKNCKIASPENSKKCDVCGATFNRSATVKKIITTLAAVSILAVCSLYIYQQPNFFDNGNEIDIHQPLPKESENLVQPESSHLAGDLNSDKELDDLFVMLTKVYDGAAKYLRTSSQSKPYISKKGFLFDIIDSKLVTIQDLINANLLDKSYEDKNIFLMYIAPTDLKDYGEIDFPDSSSPNLFIGQEAKEGIALVSGDRNGVIYREHYSDLIEKYTFDNGEIKRPSADSADYKKILDSVLAYDFITSSVDVHFMALDDKYAVVNISTVVEPTRISGYVLENIDGEFTVKFSHFEDYLTFQADIHGRLMDLNIDLLPSYNLFVENNNLKRNFPFLISKLIIDDIITSKDKVAFSAGNDKYAYIVFESGLQILSNHVEDSSAWNCVEVTNWRDAETKLAEMEKTNPPTYIICQQ